MNVKYIITSAIFAIFSSSAALAGGIPIGNWDFQLQNSSGGDIIYAEMTGSCDTLIQNNTFAQGTTQNAFTTAVKGYGKCGVEISYSGTGTGTVCKITVNASATEQNDTTTKYNATASYEGYCTGPTSLGNSGSFTVTVNKQ